MPANSAYVIERATAIRERMDELLDAARQVVATQTRLGANEVRVLRQELKEIVKKACLHALPKDSRAMMSVVSREPSWLDAELPSTEDYRPNASLLDALRHEMADSLMSALNSDIHAAVMSQYKGATFASVVEEIRAVITAADYVGTGKQTILEEALQKQEACSLPTVRALLPSMHEMRRALTVAVKAGDQTRCAPARALLELADLVDARGYGLDKTHVRETNAPGLKR